MGFPILFLTCRPRPMFNYRPIIGLYASESMGWSSRAGPDRSDRAYRRRARPGLRASAPAAVSPPRPTPGPRRLPDEPSSSSSRSSVSRGRGRFGWRPTAAARTAGSRSLVRHSTTAGGLGVAHGQGPDLVVGEGGQSGGREVRPGGEGGAVGVCQQGGSRVGGQPLPRAGCTCRGARSPRRRRRRAGPGPGNSTIRTAAGPSASSRSGTSCGVEGLSAGPAGRRRAARPASFLTYPLRRLHHAQCPPCVNRPPPPGAPRDRPYPPASSGISLHTCLPPLTGTVPQVADMASTRRMPRPPVGLPADAGGLDGRTG